MAKRIITLKLTKRQAKGLMDAVNMGIADLHDAQDDESDDTATAAQEVADKLGQAMAEAWPDDSEENAKAVREMETQRATSPPEQLELVRKIREFNATRPAGRMPEKRGD